MIEIVWDFNFEVEIINKIAANCGTNESVRGMTHAKKTKTKTKVPDTVS